MSQQKQIGTKTKQCSEANDSSLKKYLIALSDEIYNISSNLNILTRLSWPSHVKNSFFRSKANRLPKIKYPKYNPDTALKKIDVCRKSLRGTEYDAWLTKHMNNIENSVLMLANLGTQEFFNYSKKLYGQPKDTLKDEQSTSYGLASELLKLTKPMKSIDLGEPPTACILADTVAKRMRESVTRFGELAPEILIVDELSANALAGAERVRIRKTACFTDKDIEQLVEHEINIHVATLLNGKNPENSKLLGSVNPGSTKTQEGLAVFAELITGNMDIDRMQRLSNRVIAIQMAIDGADFIEVYRYFLEFADQEQSFENARRVFRGGLITGCSPFTKDIVYLDGLLRVHNFLRAAVKSGKIEQIRMLFVGRLDIEDLTYIKKLKQIGLCADPMFLPSWVKDMRFLLSYLCYSSFLNSVDMSRVSEHYNEMLQAL
ncbi:flavohemoglobin expression-modulating QEGLA motif protein [Aliikangiella sp. IMCC44359]|uniref:flavohemoglobin expression-modulating QEGLA motif protein n=1 Tax=Aliikangiella sp. IMCC44359 TaxID=3459125 RepID=UPI00403B10D9